MENELQQVVVDGAEMPLPGTSSISQDMEDQPPSDLPSANDVEMLDSEIPGLDSSLVLHESQDTIEASQSSTIDTQGTYLDQVATSFDKSEESSLKESAVESATVSLSSQLLLPKMSMPAVHLSEEEKNNLQKLCFMHIIDAYKQIAAAGGSQIRSSLLVYLGAEVKYN